MTTVDPDLVLCVQDLEPLPMTVTRLARLVTDPNADIRDMVEVISLDQALTVRLLRAANSAASGSRSEIKTVDRAVVRLGTGAVLSIAVAAGVRGRMMAARPEAGLAEGQLWAHSVAAALAAESMPGIVRGVVPPETFTAALLHDVGRLIAGRSMEDGVRRLLRARSEDPGEDDRPLTPPEHGELGYLVAQHWGLPESICDAIRYHHDPPACPAAPPMDRLPWLVLLADHVARNLGRGLDDTTPDEAEMASVADHLGLDAARTEKLLYRTSLRLDQIEERFH